MGLHQVAFLNESTTAFLDHCRQIGVQHTTLVTPSLMRPGGVDEARQALAAGAPQVEAVNHQFAVYPDLDHDRGEATQKLLQAIDIAAALGASSVYLQTGGRGHLTWEQAAERFTALIATCKAAAAAEGVRVLVENASSFNADIHIAHTLADTITLAGLAGIGLCIEWHACWMEAGLKTLLRQAIPMTGLMQVSDYVLGDRTAPCRAVPGDGVIPLDRILGDVLEAGYEGVFDIELVGPRIAAEGARAATQRAAQRVSEILTRLGA
ncbi:MAG TPA: sugar phosphate isomerase/epimerase [Mycobacterium sp.]|nr:sugar phosphate isomerase/epimerase [Mycobacterium sp.]